MAKIIFKNPLSFQNGTGFTTDPANTEVNALTPVVEVIGTDLEIFNSKILEHKTKL